MKKILVDGTSELTRVAALADGRLEDLAVCAANAGASVGDIFIVRLDKVLPNGMAFAGIGDERVGFIQPMEGKEASAGLKNGSIAAVQVVKEAYDNKRALLSTHISLKGEKGLAVLIMGEKSAGVSEKIKDLRERERLRAIASSYSDSFGVIIRTAAEGAAEEELRAELDELVKKAEKIRQAECFAKPPHRVCLTDELTEIVKEMYTEGTQIITANEELNEKLKRLSPALYTDTTPLFAAYGVQSELKKLLQRRVWLKSGGNIVIDEDEALSVIDVNSGKALGKKALIRVNEEAAEEIARQLRLRNLSGMIVVDFISVGNIDEVVKLLRRLVKADRVLVRVFDATETGLVQITRQKRRKPLRSLIMRSCPHCDGSGYIKNADYIAMSIAGEVGAIFAQTTFTAAEVSAGAQVAAALERLRDGIEAKYGKRLIIKKIVVGRFDHYELKRLYN